MGIETFERNPNPFQTLVLHDLMCCGAVLRQLWSTLDDALTLSEKHRFVSCRVGQEVVEQYIYIQTYITYIRFINYMATWLQKFPGDLGLLSAGDRRPHGDVERSAVQQGRIQQRPLGANIEGHLGSPTKGTFGRDSTKMGYLGMCDRDIMDTF